MWIIIIVLIIVILTIIIGRILLDNYQLCQLNKFILLQFLRYWVHKTNYDELPKIIGLPNSFFQIFFFDASVSIENDSFELDKKS